MVFAAEETATPRNIRGQVQTEAKNEERELGGVVYAYGKGAYVKPTKTVVIQEPVVPEPLPVYYGKGKGKAHGYGYGYGNGYGYGGYYGYSGKGKGKSYGYGYGPAKSRYYQYVEPVVAEPVVVVKGKGAW